MWVGLVQEIHEAVEQHYGPEYAFAERRAGLISTVGKFFSLGIWFSSAVTKGPSKDLLEKFAGPYFRTKNSDY